MSNNNETFATLMKRFEYQYDLRTTFDDFLTMTICAFSRNPMTGLSFDEDLYMATIDKYKDDELRFLFPKALASLTDEMTERLESNSCNDILGEFYELNLYRKGAQQYFTPWPICQFMAKASFNVGDRKPEQSLRILDPACGSGRMLLASAKDSGPTHEYYGIDTDHACVKMTAINLFLGGLFKSEVMCANALLPDDFRVSYVISFIPFGIFKIEEKEKSRLWKLCQNTLKRPEKEFKPFSEWDTPKEQPVLTTQLKLF